MVPARFVQLDALPLSPNGKVDRKALPPPNTRTLVVGKGGAPQTKTEKAIATLWSQLLRVDGIAINDDFFDLGADSLRATALVAHLHETFGVSLALASVFERPTITGLAEVVDLLTLTSRDAVSAGSAPREEFDL